MLRYYKQSLMKLFEALDALRANPYEHTDEVLAIQEVIIERVTYVERQVRRSRRRIKEIEQLLAARQERVVARSLKREKDRLNQTIQDYRDVLYIFRAVGDALAYQFFSPWD